MSLYWCIVCTIYNAPFTGAVVGSSCYTSFVAMERGKVLMSKMTQPDDQILWSIKPWWTHKFFSLQPIFIKLLEFILPLSCRNAGFYQACSFSHQYDFLLNVYYCENIIHWNWECGWFNCLNRLEWFSAN